MRFPAHPGARVRGRDPTARDGRPGRKRRRPAPRPLPHHPHLRRPVARDIRQHDSELYVVRVWNPAGLATASLSREITIGTVSGATTVGVDLTSARSPSLQSAKVDVDSLKISAVLDSVESATVTCCPHQPEAPLDATVYELTFGEELNETRYRWFGDAPAGWEALGSFVSRFLRLVDEPADIAAR